MSKSSLEKIILMGRIQLEHGSGPLPLHKSPWYFRLFKPWRWKNRNGKWVYMTRYQYDLLFNS